MSKTPQTSKNQPHPNVPLLDGNEANLCDPRWETLDPNPDIYTLFVQFDKRFFWNSLGMVEVGWSKELDKT